MDEMGDIRRYWKQYDEEGDESLQVKYQKLADASLMLAQKNKDLNEFLSGFGKEIYTSMPYDENSKKNVASYLLIIIITETINFVFYFKRRIFKTYKY